MKTRQTKSSRCLHAAGSVTAVQIVTDLLANPYPHDLMAIRHEVNMSYGTDEEGEQMARAEMDTYCTEDFMIDARHKWKAAQDAAREWLSSQA
jgi:hypothetical protein